MIGIYAVTNTTTGQMYIGRAVKIGQRLYQHRYYLRLNRHTNPHLQASFNKYGEAAFTFRTLIVCRREDTPFYERLLIAGFHTDDRRYGYNLTIALLDKLTHTPEAKAAISAFQSVFQITNHYVMTAEIKEKIASGLRGKVGCNKGRVYPPEIRAKLGAPKGHTNNLGRIRREDEKAKISATLRQKYIDDPSLRVQLSLARQGRKQAMKERFWKWLAVGDDGDDELVLIEPGEDN